MNQFYSWQVRSPDCFAKVIDKSLLKEGTTGIPQKVMNDFFGRLLGECEEVSIELIAADIQITCKIRRFQNRHRLFMAPLRQFLHDNSAGVDDLIIFDRSLSDSSHFYISIISSDNSLLIAPIESKLVIGENVKTTSSRRIGQEAFKELLLRKYNSRCCLSGVHDVRLSSKSILRASHIKSWAESTPHEKLDVNNGLLLAPHYDILFDKKLISFHEDGSLLSSKLLPNEIHAKWSLPQLKLPALTSNMEFYMKQHRQQLEL